MTEHKRGIYNMACWNGLSTEQQQRLIKHGNLPLGYRPEGECMEGATVEIDMPEHDEAPGPRFYCVKCAIMHLVDMMIVLRTIEIGAVTQ